MPTIAGLRRRGYPAAAIRHFCEEVGTSRSDGTVDMAMLESAVRDHLNQHAPRARGVMQPLRLTLTNLAEPLVLTVPNHPADPEFGSRELVMGSELFIDQADFREEANKQFKRLVLGKRVRLRGGLVIEGERCEKDADGNIVRVLARCVTSVPGTDPEDGVKPKGVIQWVSAEHGLLATIRRYDRLFAVPEPAREDDMLAALNPKSLEVIEGAMVEPGVSEGEPEQVFQFEREGYFVADRYDHAPGSPVFNLTIGLRDTWSASHG